MDQPNGQVKQHHELDILIRPSSVFLFLNLLVIHGILWVGILLVTLVPNLFFRSVADTVRLFNFQTITTLVLVAVGELATMMIIIRWVTEFYIIKNESLTHREGIFFKQKRVLMIRQIVEVSLQQNLIGHLCNYGTLRISTPQAEEGILIKRVENPNKYFKVLRELSLKQQVTDKDKKPIPPVAENED
jgi:uncharacterized membrane protein YdbT with pleckstrin-like domain